MNDLAIYDQRAAEWWSGSVKWLRTLQNMVPARLRYFDQFVHSWAGRHVLDLGCGGGFMSEALAARGARVIGIDPAARAIGAALVHSAATGLEIDYRVGHGEAIELPDGSVDVVVCVDVLEHVDSLEDTIAEISRVLRPGGLFLFDTINRNLVARFLVITMAENVVGLLQKGTHDSALFIKPRELRIALETSGFGDIKFAGLGPTGIDANWDCTFGQVPTTLVQYMGVAQRAHDVVRADGSA